jgi:hypothetical protein
MSEMKKFERIRRLETVKKYEPYQLAGMLDDLIDELQEQKAAAEKKGWEDIHVTVETYYENECEIAICAWRWETDKEFDKRWEDWKHHLEKKKKRQQRSAELAQKKLHKTEEEERAMYEQLKRKFGNV